MGPEPSGPSLCKLDKKPDLCQPVSWSQHPPKNNNNTKHSCYEAGTSMFLKVQHFLSRLHTK